MKKTYISEVNLANVNETVMLKGWVHAIRDFGGKTFFDLRDSTGLMQVVMDSEIIKLKKEIKELKDGSS